MIIGICGEQGSGKSTAGHILVEEYGFYKIAFADTLKDIVAVMFGWKRELLEGDTEESRIWRETVDEWWCKHLGIIGFTPRMALQMIGTNAMRDGFHPEIWVSIVERRLSEYKNVVITDVRFSNEIKMIRKNGGHILRIERDNNNSPIHKSELEWRQSGVNYTLKNDGTMDELREKIGHILFLIVNETK
jgi:hypothetical protein